MKKLTTLLLTILVLFSLSACNLPIQEKSEKWKVVEINTWGNTWINTWSSSDTNTWSLSFEDTKDDEVVRTGVTGNCDDSVKETSDFILSGNSWLYTNNNYGFSLKLPKKYWNSPRVDIFCITPDSITVEIQVPYVKWEWSDVYFEFTETPTHLKLWGFELLTKKDYKKQLLDKYNRRAMFNISGIEILRDLTIWKNNKYFFIGAFWTSDFIVENRKNIIPTLDCKLQEKWYYLSNEDYIPDDWDCDDELNNLFPEWYLTIFDI